MENQKPDPFAQKKAETDAQEKLSAPVDAQEKMRTGHTEAPKNELAPELKSLAGSSEKHGRTATPNHVNRIGNHPRQFIKTPEELAKLLEKMESGQLLTLPEQEKIYHQLLSLTQAFAKAKKRLHEYLDKELVS